MKLKKIIALSTVAIMSLAMFTGCGSKETADNGEMKLVKDGTLTVGLEATYPPMEYIDEETGELAGFDIELAKAIAADMGLEVEFVQVGFDAIFAGLDADKYDVVISAISVTEERQETLELSDTYLANQQVIISAKDGSQITSVDQLTGKKVAVQVGTTADEACQYYQNDKAMEFDLQQFDDMTAAFLALKSGSVDCVVTDLVVGDYYVNNNPNDYVKSCDNLTNEPIAIAAKKGNTAIINAVNESLKSLIDSGKTAEISKELFGEDLTKNIDSNLKNYDEQ